MAKYIDIDKFREAYGFGRRCNFCEQKGLDRDCTEQSYTRSDICSWLDDAEEEFSQPHGKWLSNGAEFLPFSKCSICGSPWGSSAFKYCPHCGAKMVESEVDE